MAQWLHCLDMHLLRALVHRPALACLALALCGCVVPPAPVQWRLSVLPKPGLEDATVLASRASAVAGVPVRVETEGAPPGWRRLILSCPDVAACEQGSDRLVAAEALFAGIRGDTDRQIPHRPSGPSNQ
jgi:hypothetical protein